MPSILEIYIFYITPAPLHLQDVGTRVPIINENVLDTIEGCLNRGSGMVHAFAALKKAISSCLNNTAPPTHPSNVHRERDRNNAQPCVPK
jgi:hypothetical protein